MEIFITEESIIRSIQQDFRKAWPNLKIEFYRNPHASFEASPLTDQLPPDTPIEEVRNIHTSAWIDISGDVTVKALEEHGIGILKRPYLRLSRTAEEIEKYLFDALATLVLDLLERYGSLEDAALGPLLEAARRRFGAGASDPIPL